MSKLIFTSPSSETRGVYLLDTSSFEYERYHEELVPMGLIKHGDYFLLADRHDGVSILDKDLKIIQRYPCTGRDLHDIRIVGDNFYVAESYGNRINIFTINEGKFIDDIRINKIPFELHHLNSFDFHNNELYISMFSLSGTKEFKQARDGTVSIFDIETGNIKKVVSRNLYQPHSIHFINDDLYFCESGKHKVCKGNGSKVFLQTTKYSRGLDSDSKYMYIGQSVDRNEVISDGLHGSVLICDLETKEYKEIPLPVQDIYEVMILND